MIKKKAGPFIRAGLFFFHISITQAGALTKELSICKNRQRRSVATLMPIRVEAITLGGADGNTSFHSFSTRGSHP